MSNINKQWVTVPEGVDTSKQVQKKRFTVIKDLGHKILNIINWEQKRQEKRLENDRLLAQKKEKLQQRMDLVSQEIDVYIQKVVKAFQRQNEEIERQNTTCPNCQGKEVVNHILSWCIEWKDTTLTVCHCSDCSNEWLSNENEEENATCWKCNSWSIVHRILKNWYIKDWENWIWSKRQKEIETVCYCNWCTNERVKQEKKEFDVEYIKRLSHNLAWRLEMVIGECLYHKYDDDIDPNDSGKLNEKRVQNLCEQIEKMPGYKDLSIESLEYLRWLGEQYRNYSYDPYDYRFYEKTVKVLKQLWFKHWLE